MVRTPSVPLIEQVGRGAADFEVLASEIVRIKVAGGFSTEGRERKCP